MRQQECFGVQKDFLGLKYEYVSTAKGMSKQNIMCQRKFKNGIVLLFNIYLGNRLLRDSSTQQQHLPISTLKDHLG